MLGPIFALGRLVNTAATAYVVGQIGWKAFKEIRSMQQEKMRACEIRAKFIAEYQKKHNGEKPSEELVQMALNAANAVDQPVRHRIGQFLKSTGDKMRECVDFAADVVESVNQHCTTQGCGDDAAEEEKNEVCQHRPGDSGSEPFDVRHVCVRGRHRRSLGPSSS